MFFKRIDFVSLVLSKLIINIIFFICSTPATLRLYILIIYTGPLYIWIIIITMFRLTDCQDYKAGLISLLIMKHIYVIAFGLYRSWNPQGQYVDCV